mgnify:FL=1|tara:strand:- start:4452 stop:7265 length:2814 start_codon:yes stop_codon:yes gene_type:complete
MANDKIYVSPGVFTSEKDLTFIAQQVGVTTLGIVGETVKGPAFEPIFITNYGEYSTIFGGLNPKLWANGKPKYEASYIARQYLTESNQLFVTRILGLTGYDAGAAWCIVADANYDPSTVLSATSTTFTAEFSGSVSTIDFFNFVGAGSGQAEYLIDLNSGINVNPYTGVGTDFALPSVNTVLWDKVGTNFTGATTVGEVTSQDSVALTGTVSGNVFTYTASAYTQYENKVLAMVRSRADVVSNVLYWKNEQSAAGLVGDFSSALENPLANFTLSASTSGFTNTTVFDVSLDSSARNYLPRVLGSTCSDRETPIWVEEIYPSMLADLQTNQQILGLKSQLLHFNTFDNYQQRWQTPETPWLVSELRGNKVEKLFKCVTISDGNGANKEIKISIARINLETKTFDVIVREFLDTDARPQILERFSNCSLDSSDNSFVGERIGTADGEYPLRSQYIMLVLNPDAPIDSFPSGFEGYRVRDYVSTTSVVANAPELEYKSSYNLTVDKIRRVYLGISNTVGIDQNMFNWKGYTNEATPTPWTATTKGFHMDISATTAGNFIVGCCPFTNALAIAGTVYESVNARKFTLVPYLGFDGWNCHRESSGIPRTNTDTYKVGKAGFTAGLSSGEFTQIGTTLGTSDYYAYSEAIQTFQNPESVNINVLTTPGIDYQSNLSLVDETIDMVEDERADSIYILTSPDGAVTDDSTFDLAGLGFSTIDKLTPTAIVDLLDDADIDSNYTATYWPWIQMKDTENSVNIFLPPTLEVVKDIALTDNIAFPWYATAGYTRGRTVAIQPRTKLTEDMRDTLYEGRINPMAFFSDEGVLIWGNKNLQVKDSALDRLNIRRLLLQTRKLISAVAVRLLFEQNDQIVRNQFLNLVNPILDNIRRERGLADFRVQLSSDPEEIDRNEMRGKIFLKPVPTLEFIILEFNVTPTGASFDDV